MWYQMSTFDFALGRIFVFCNVHLVVFLFEIKTHLLDVGDSFNGQSSDIALHLDTVSVMCQILSRSQSVGSRWF